MNDFDNNGFFDASKLAATTGTFRIHQPELSEWTCIIFGDTAYGFQYTPLKGKEPFWFHRFMQWVCFGHIWIRRKE